MIFLASCCNDVCDPVIISIPIDTTGLDSAFFTYGGAASDNFMDIVQTPDGGFAMTGSTESFGDGSTDVYLVKVDSAGQLEWSRAIGGSGTQEGFGLAATSDGGFAVVGSGDAGIYVARTDGNGVVEWEKSYGGYRGEDIVNAPDGGLVFTGSSSGMCVIKTDAAGNIEWEVKYTEGFQQSGRSIVATPDGGYVVSGDAYNNLEFGIDLVVLRVTSAGDTLWSRQIEKVGNSWGEAIICITGGGFLVTGMTENYQCGLFKLDDSGDVLWSRGFGRTGHTEGYGLAELSDGGFAITGDIFGPDIDFFLAKTDANGNLLWMRTLGGDEEDRGMSLVATEDDGLAVAGFGVSSLAGKADGVLYLTDKDGQVLPHRP